MLKSMKQKFGGGGGKRPTSGSGARDDDKPAPSTSASSSRAPSTTSASTTPDRATSRAGSAGRPLNSSASTVTHHSHPDGNEASSGSVKEKPPLPDLSPEARDIAYAEALPAFREVPQSEKQLIFVKKLHLCSYTFDFTDHNWHMKEKEVKRQTLLELVDYVNTGTGKFTDAVAEDVVFMLSSNLLRALPPTKAHDQDNMDPDEEEPTLEPAWPHLQIVYEFLLRYIVANDTDAKTAKKYIDQRFVVRLLELFDSEDPRERDYLKTILHRIYGKFMVHRPFIRKAINHVFYHFIFETEHHNGVAELLEILGSIINGFALPLKEEHKTFLSKALMPLHKPKCVGRYHQQLDYCVTQFVEKDPKLAEAVLRALLRCWPLTNSQKEVLFLQELEEVLEMTQAQEFGRVVVPLFTQLARCLNSSHFQVAERSLFFWNNDYFVGLVTQKRQEVLPLVYGALEANARSHWNPAVHDLSCNVQKMFQELDEPLFEQCRQRHEAEESRRAVLEENRLRNWQAVEQAAAQRQEQAASQRKKGLPQPSGPT